MTAAGSVLDAFASEMEYTCVVVAVLGTEDAQDLSGAVPRSGVSENGGEVRLDDQLLVFMLVERGMFTVEPEVAEIGESEAWAMGTFMAFNDNAEREVECIED